MADQEEANQRKLENSNRKVLKRVRVKKDTRNWRNQKKVVKSQAKRRQQYPEKVHE